MKDRFSTQSALYATFRPSYPSALAEWLAHLAPDRQCVWDCATGNGQMASLLAAHFKQVIATDISAHQLAHSIPAGNIEYRLEPAHCSSLGDASADAIVVAQAIHWFSFDDFYEEVRRVAKPDALMAAIGYALPVIEHPELQAVFTYFYREITGPFWDPERCYIDELYRTIPFPFQEITMPLMESTYLWSLDALLGYLNTWSAVQKMIRENGSDPVSANAGFFEEAWPNEGAPVKVKFPIIGRMGRV